MFVYRISDHQTVYIKKKKTYFKNNFHIKIVKRLSNQVYIVIRTCDPNFAKRPLLLIWGITVCLLYSNMCGLILFIVKSSHW